MGPTIDGWKYGAFLIFPGTLGKEDRMKIEVEKIKVVERHEYESDDTRGTRYTENIWYRDVYNVLPEREDFIAVRDKLPLQFKEKGEAENFISSLNEKINNGELDPVIDEEAFLWWSRKIKNCSKAELLSLCRDEYVEHYPLEGEYLGWLYDLGVYPPEEPEELEAEIWQDSVTRSFPKGGWGGSKEKRVRGGDFSELSQKEVEFIGILQKKGVCKF